MKPSASAAPRTWKGLVLVLGISLGVSALQPMQEKVVFQEDAGAEVLVSRAASVDFEFAAPEPFIKRAIGGGDVVTNGRGVHVRGPVTFVGSAAAGRSGASQLVVWDEYSGEVEHGGSFDVLGAVVRGNEVGTPFVIAAGPRYQGRPTVPADSGGCVGGSFLVAWEEGADGWGGPYRSVDQRWNNATDTRGPLHSWRSIKLAIVTASGSVTEIPVPMPSFETQQAERNRRSGTERLGVFYERPVLHAATGDTAAWLAYRHVHQRESSLHLPRMTTHVERGFSLYLLRLNGGYPDRLYRIDERQRDGEQRLAFVPSGENFQVAFETGRADRREDTQSKGVRVVDLPPFPVTILPSHGVWKSNSERAPISPSPVPARAPELRSSRRASVELDDVSFTLLYGDLHRHTDLSLCFPFFDGSIDDAYRYARGPGALDFLAVTDHARDLDRGRSAGRPWRLHVAAADRHHRPGHFVAFRAYERSQADTDHNVVGVGAFPGGDADFLRPHRPPLTDFWEEFSANQVLTIPHATAGVPGARFSGDVWEKRDDKRRPVAEIYQGYRDVSSMEELRSQALASGQKLGFIASSDHLATSSAYACVWAEGEAAEALDRQPVFDALQARRCYGATARIELRVTAQGQGAASATHWMGADLPAGTGFTIRIWARGTGPIAEAEVWTLDGKLDVLPAGGQRELDTTFQWKASARDYLFIRLVQEDGEQAWSSPFFVGWDSVPAPEGR